MVRTSNSLFRRPCPGSRSAQLLLWLMCLVTWRGPLPVLHAHAGENVADTQLDWHLHSYHRGETGHRFLDWHLHVMLPWQCFDATDCNPSSMPHSDPLTHDGVPVSATGWGEMQTSLGVAHLQSALHVLPSLQLLEEGLAATPQAGAPEASAYLTSLLLRAPLCAVTGVALC